MKTKPYILFDCFQTLLYKEGLALAIQDFIKEKADKDVSVSHINTAIRIQYERRKFNHPKFENKEHRLEFYKKYNQELLQLLGIEISSDLALELNKKLSVLPYSIYPDVKEILKYFQAKNFKLGVLANWTSTLKSVLEKSGIAPYFDFISSSDDLGVAKPDVGIFKDALRKIGQDYSSIYYIGDDYDLDIVPARQVGFKAVLIDREGFYPNQTDCLKLSDLVGLKDIIS